MERMTAKILRCYGREIRLCSAAGERTVRGFFQPDTDRKSVV